MEGPRLLLEPPFRFSSVVDDVFRSGYPTLRSFLFVFSARFSPPFSLLVLMEGPRLLLEPPFRFSSVVDDVFRSGYPTLRSFRFLRRLRLRTIISLVPETPTSDLREFCVHRGIELVHIQTKKHKEGTTVEKDILMHALQILFDPSRGPVLLHCLDGANVTGQVFMALRKLLGWDEESVLAEFQQFSREHGVEKEERRFLRSLSAAELVDSLFPPSTTSPSETTGTTGLMDKTESTTLSPRTSDPSSLHLFPPRTNTPLTTAEETVPTWFLHAFHRLRPVSSPQPGTDPVQYRFQPADTAARWRRLRGLFLEGMVPFEGMSDAPRRQRLITSHEY
eukprot:TRINITY_DN43404_c0_g1_i1.p1 TRINITY_DN43404_c0_g1~~TRINITY_DN43404_c0_g1_i1.p1  ORF type:complete len:366 (-),score=74.50 TRINITY_DN43404_c0_g1_i1:49-1053(-)